MKIPGQWAFPQDLLGLRPAGAGSTAAASSAKLASQGESATCIADPS